jgi:ATP-dependent Clp protease ATP-binding subunit ClpA
VAVTKQKQPPPSFEEILPLWLDRDASAAADAGEIGPAFEIDDVIERITEVLASRMHPLVIGDPGVGKTAALLELVRRARTGDGPAALRERRVLALSFRRRLAAMKQGEPFGQIFQTLADALCARGDVVPYFVDLHAVSHCFVAPQLTQLATRLGAPVLCEGEATAVRSMLEDEPAIEQHFVTLPVDEPDLDRTLRILRRHRDATAGGAGLDDDALETAMLLAHRFLPRGRQPRKSFDLVHQVASVAGKRGTVGAEQVIERFQQAYRVPRFLIDPRERLDLDALARELGTRLLGQPQAVQAVVRTIGAIKAGLSDPRRPFGVFLFVGPTGVGKTHLAQLLAERLFGGRDRLVRVNMADFPAPGDAGTLFGQQYGDLATRRGLLTRRLLGHPFAVVLFDEFEKAAPVVHDRFFQLVDEGELVNGAGETISCRANIFIATSNAGTEVYYARSIGFSAGTDLAELEHALERRLHQTFRVEFLNRFDQIVHFHPLGRGDIRTIALREVEELGERVGVRRRGLRLEVDEELLDWLTAHGHDPLHGARFLRRAIERHVTTALARTIVQSDPERGSKVALRVRGGRVVASVVDAARAEAHTVTLPHGPVERTQTLERGALAREVQALLERARPRLAELERKREEASALLARMSAESTWNERERARAELAQYRALDLEVQRGLRWAEPIQWLEELAARAPHEPRRLGELARNLERAARALAEWEDRLAEEGPRAVWLVLRDVDPMHGGARWLEELCEMELAWCRRLGLGAELVACAHTDERLSRLVLDVDGPGAASYLAMEHGLHRLQRNAEPDLRVRVDVVQKGPRPADVAPPVSERPAEGPLGLVVRARRRLVVEERGLVVELSASSAETLAHVLAELSRELGGEGDAAAVARLYADAGAGARDPRTGAVVARYRDVVHGKLDSLLEAWRRARVC